jgi:hypothetical protein
MTDTEFKRILVRYLNKKASAAERLIIERWYENMHGDTADECDFETLESRLWNRISDGIRQDPRD